MYKTDFTSGTFYCNCDFLFEGNKGIVDFSRCSYKPRKNEIRAKRLEWEHVMPVELFGRHLECWNNGGRKGYMKRS